MKAGKLHNRNNHEMILQQELMYEGYIDTMNECDVNYEVIDEGKDLVYWGRNDELLKEEDYWNSLDEDDWYSDMISGKIQRIL